MRAGAVDKRIEHPPCLSLLPPSSRANGERGTRGLAKQARDDRRASTLQLLAVFPFPRYRSSRTLGADDSGGRRGRQGAIVGVSAWNLTLSRAVLPGRNGKPSVYRMQHDSGPTTNMASQNGHCCAWARQLLFTRGMLVICHKSSAKRREWRCTCCMKRSEAPRHLSIEKSETDDSVAVTTNAVSQLSRHSFGQCRDTEC